MEGYKTKKGYLRVELEGKGFCVHRLVALAFLPQIKGKTQVNHIDGRKDNNKVDNLEWCNNSENQKHAYKIGLHRISPNAGRKKKKVGKYTLDNKLIAIYNSLSEATKKNFVIGKSSIRCAIIKKTKLYNFRWRFIND